MDIKLDFFAKYGTITIMKRGLINKVINRTKTIVDGGIDNTFFEKALDELESGQRDKGVWARAVSVSGGDEGLAKSKYIKFRAEHLWNKELHARNIQSRDFYQLDEEDFSRIEDKALKSVGSFMGFYLWLGILAIGLFAFIVIAGKFEPGLLWLFLGGLILILPYFITKRLNKRKTSKQIERKKRVNRIFLATVLASFALTFIGCILAVILIFKWISFNKKIRAGNR